MDPKGFTQQVNLELKQLWESRTGFDPLVDRKIQGIDAKIANIRRAIEDGLCDAGWANARLGELLAERKALEGKSAVQTEPPQIDVKTALAYRRLTEKVLGQGIPAERKKLLRGWVQDVKLVPEGLEVDIIYRLPESVMKGVVAGVRLEVLQKNLGRPEAFALGRMRCLPLAV